MNENDLSILLRVVIAAVLAGVLGWERESAGKSAGLRTHVLIGISGVLFVAIGQYMMLDFRAYGDHVRFDAANLIGAIVTGISFLGAGMIVFRKEAGGIKGLTTAAGVLTTAAIGVLVGLERYFVAVGSTAIVFAVLRFARYFEDRFLGPEEKQLSEQNDKNSRKV